MADSSFFTDQLTPLLLESLPDHAIFMLDTQGKILTWAPSIERIFGYNEAEFVGQNVELIFTPDDRRHKAPQQEQETARARGRAEDVRWHLRKDGTLFWATGQLIALPNDAGELQGFAKILRDDTTRKHLEERLKEISDRLQSALDAGSIGTWRWDIKPDNVVADANLARFFGVSDEDAQGGPIDHYMRAIHPDDFERVAAAIDESVETDLAFAEDYRLLQKDGSLLWVEARGKIEKDEQGNPMRLDGVILDITQRKNVEAALGQTEERYRTLFNSIDAGFCVIEMLFDDEEKPYDYLFLEVNPAFEDQTGLINPIGKTARELVPGLDQYWFDTYGKVALTGEPVRFENHAPAMHRWFDVYAFHAGEPNGHRVAVLFNDISQRKQGETALMEAREKAEESNRLKDEFLATLSHELRSPLNAILGWANLLRTNELDKQTQNDGLEVIERNARAQAELVEDLLDVSRILTGKLRLELRPLEVGGVLEEAVLTSTPTAEAKRIQIHADIDHSAGLISGDPHRLRQVFWNLLSNAIKFTPKEGHVWVKMSVVESQMQIQITDTGRGIAPEFLPYVFERFRQADASSTRSHGGLGIGLGLVKHLVEAHAGTVAANSRGEGQGAAFTVRFPLLSVRPSPPQAPLTPNVNGSASKAELPAATKTTPLVLQGRRILVVDDEPDARDMIAFALTRRGAHVEIADSAQNALERITTAVKSQEPFDILISDIGMPEADGYSLIQSVRSLEAEQGGNLAAVALTAYASPKDRARAFDAGFQSHLSKPIDAREMVATIVSLIGQTEA